MLAKKKKQRLTPRSNETALGKGRELEWGDAGTGMGQEWIMSCPTWGSVLILYWAGE